MSDNITSKKMMDEIEKLIQNYIDIARKQNQVPTRDDILEVVTNRLEKLQRIVPENKEISYIVSGMAMGIAIVLQIDELLKWENRIAAIR